MRRSTTNPDNSFTSLTLTLSKPSGPPRGREDTRALEPPFRCSDVVGGSVVANVADPSTCPTPSVVLVAKPRCLLNYRCGRVTCRALFTCAFRGGVRRSGTASTVQKALLEPEGGRKGPWGAGSCGRRGLSSRSTFGEHGMMNTTRWDHVLRTWNSRS